MTIDAYMDGIRANIARVKRYELGMDGRGGGCDCIGLIIGGIRLAGGKWDGTHGSNWAARNAVKQLNETSNKNELHIGDMVFKARGPGHEKYDMPEKYKNSGDLNDYYHVGVVMGVEPLQITHCTGVPGGIKTDSSLGEWKYHGQYIGITEEITLGTEATYAVTGGQLKMRSGPGTNYNVIAYIPNGKQVMGAKIDGEPDWIYTKYGKDIGYCMARYLVPVDQNDGDTITIKNSDWDRLNTLTKEMAAILSNAVIKG